MMKQKTMSKDSRQKYKEQKKAAKQRGIIWQLSYPVWYKIWQESGHWYERGRKKGQYVMSRPGDKGPYAVWNIKIKKHSDNTRECWIGKRHSSTTRDKMSKSQTGPKNSMFGRKASKETRSKMSLARIGNKNLLGYKHSQASLEKMSRSQRARYKRKEE